MVRFLLNWTTRPDTKKKRYGMSSGGGGGSFNTLHVLFVSVVVINTNTAITMLGQKRNKKKKGQHSIGCVLFFGIA